VNCPEKSPSDESTFRNSFVPSMTNLLGPRLANLTHVYYEATDQELVERLKKHDFTKEGLPDWIGGSWSVEQFKRWLELRLRFEWDLPPVRTKKGLDETLPHIPAHQPKSRGQQTPDEERERTRRMNVLNSRRKRERVRFEKGMYRDEANELSLQNRDLREENAWLEALLQMARAEVDKVKANII
jgi:hypothetical protein